MNTRKIMRGDIYKVRIPYGTGHEMLKDRSAVVVSCDKLNETSPCVTMVYCSTSTRRDLPEHIMLRSGLRPCIAMCEHIYTVDKTRLIEYQGHVTGQELLELDVGLMVGQGLDYGALMNRVEELTRALDAAQDKLSAPAPLPADYESLQQEAQLLRRALADSQARVAVLQEAQAHASAPRDGKEEAKLRRELEAAKMGRLQAETERDVYKGLYDTLLNRYGRKVRREAVSA